MQIKQLQIAYAPEHDRLLLRINSADHQEVRCWLTRRMVNMLIPSLDDMMATLLSSDRPLNDVGRKALLDMSREVSLYSADFSTPFQDKETDTPLGAEPLLITQIELRPGGEGPTEELVLKLCASSGKGFEMRMAEQLQHGFADLLIRTCAQAEWGLHFKGTSSIIERPESKHLN
ncbi:MAG TPA: hypothetical protein VGE55_10270 [Limnobacter sp.]|uniref:hypothetical protein n=1 Tax=Limnobacter sp. TaxID=2003368 RepID=UPI002EDBA47E